MSQFILVNLNQRLRTSIRKESGMAWTDTTILSVDTETTGLDWYEDRIIQLGYSFFTGRKFRARYEYLFNTGIESKPEAIAVHQITNEKQWGDGEHPYNQLRRIAIFIDQMRKRDLPIVIMNAPFDLNFLITEWKRWEISFCLEGSYFFDPLVVDRYYSKNRIPSLAGGRRTLKALSDRYGIHDYPLHSAGHDSQRVGELALEIASRYGQISRATPRQLHERQVRWHNQWNTDFVEYAGRRGFQFHPVEWPHRPISIEEQQGRLFESLD
jgi:DNA polymerase III subunit epsilon